MTTITIPTTVGIDIGAETTKVVLGSAYSCEIVRTDTGLHSFPTAISFQGQSRHVGETATGTTSNKIVHLNRLFLLEDNDFLKEYYIFDAKTSNDGTTHVTVEYQGDTSKEFSASALVAMLLSSIQKNVQATIRRMGGSNLDEDSSSKISYILSIPPKSTPEFCEQLLDAAYAGGLETVQLVDSSSAYAATYHRKFPDFQGTCLVIDMGHGQTSVSIAKFGTKQVTETEDTEMEETNGSSPPFQIVASKSTASLGAASVDDKLWKHFQSTNPKLSQIRPNSKAGQRLLAGCHKMKHLLSQLPEGSVTVENVGENDTDVVLQATRSTLADLCSDDAETLRTIIQDVLHEAGLADSGVDAVEILGGGCRIPWVQAAIQTIVGSEKTLSKSLDDTSAALGAAVVGESANVSEQVVTVPEPSTEVLERRKNLREEEIAMETLDLEEKAKSDLRNKIETMVLELRSAKQGKHGGLLPGDALESYLNELDDWIYSEEADGANLQSMTDKWDDTNTKIKDMCAEYFDAVEKEQKAKEKEMEEEAKKAQLEEAMNGGDVDEEDHDNRRLPKKRRMEIVMKNKNEATELFKDGNWKFAAARYTKALSHCAKFVDLSPEDTDEVNELKVTLNLNLALAYTKMSNFDQALRCTNEALVLTDSNPKAFYRRASIYYEKKRWDDAKSDIAKATKLAPDDKAILKLAERINLQLKKQKEREKKMAAKMFS
ncbi:Hsp70 domain containing protein [Nitzschia inconspicua]|uniref:Hsp70 domain containing protein n=1 Tax=Nitzschia inconspicua TaxID=303405 RepID=A0A9K3Q5P9_9STRA|nr:Hsp70 domain containing protein [Nitzschia inconspicua]